MTTPDLDRLAALYEASGKHEWHTAKWPESWQEINTTERWIDPQNGISYALNVAEQVSTNKADWICAVHNAAPALLATARSYDALLVAVTAVVDARNDAAENAALAELATVYEQLTGRSAASGEGYSPPLRDPIAHALLQNPD